MPTPDEPRGPSFQTGVIFPGSAGVPSFFVTTAQWQRVVEQAQAGVPLTMAPIPVAAPPVAPAPAAPPALPAPATPPVAPPTPTPGPTATPGPFRPVGALPSGGESPESTRQRVERVVRDTDVRRSAPPPRVIEGETLARRGLGRALGRVIGRALGPIGAVAGIFFPSELGSGELTPEQQEEIARDFEKQNAEQLARERKELADKIDALQRARAKREPAVKTPAPLPLPPAPVPTLPTPTPAPSSTKPTPAPAPPIPLPMPRTTPKPGHHPLHAPSPQLRWPSLPNLQRVPRWTSLSLPLVPSALAPSSPSPASPPASVPAPSVPRLPSPSARPGLTQPRVQLSPSAPASTPTILTSFQPSVLGSAPPRARTPTAQDQCRCQQRRRNQKRKCRARAGVVWASGPRKGQAAGTRCISFER